MQRAISRMASETVDLAGDGVAQAGEFMQRAEASRRSYADAATDAMGQARAGQFGAVRNLGPFALALGLLAITVGAVSIVLAEMKDQVNDSTAEGVLQDGLNAMSDFGGWFGILVIMGVITIIFLFLGVIRRAGNGASA